MVGWLLSKERVVIGVKILFGYVGVTVEKKGLSQALISKVVIQKVVAVYLEKEIIPNMVIVRKGNGLRLIEHGKV